MNSLYEYVGNMHMHTPYSDGEAYHAQIAEAALRVGLDFVIVTDHNLLVNGVEGYYGDDARGYLLLLTGEEVHDQARLPQVNHCLVYGVERELAQCAANPQELVDTVNGLGGSTFLAHPTDRPIPWLKNEPPIPWVDWHVERYTGLEIWNYMTSFKEVLPTFATGLRNIFQPENALIGPPPDALALWDKLLSEGKHIVGVGSSDAHGTVFRVGPIRKAVFPYEFLFRCVNTHILTTQPLSGQWQYDAGIIYRAVKEGRTFIGYDIPGSTRGFRYTANGQNGSAIMGGSLRLGPGVTLQVLSPARAHIKLIRHGEVLAEAKNLENLTYTAHKPGAYRVEVWRSYRGKERCWILSNPIYIEDVRRT